MEHDSQPEAYRVHAWIRGIHPMLWRRFLVRSDSTLADLHVVLQIGFDWTDFYLHCFRIRKKDYAMPRLGGLACHDAREIKLADLHFRINERFLYEYDFGDLWQHQVRIEKRLEIETRRSYPVCVGGQWAGPPEDCGGPQAFLDRRAAAPWRVRELLDDLLEDIKAEDTEALDYRLEELQPWQEWLMLHRFDRRSKSSASAICGRRAEVDEVERRPAVMKLKVQLIIESDSGETEAVQEVAKLERGSLRRDDLGLTLSEAKDLLQEVQKAMVTRQTTRYVTQQIPCPKCGEIQLRKGKHQIVLRTLFGKLRLDSPRQSCARPPLSRSRVP